MTAAIIVYAVTGAIVYGGLPCNTSVHHGTISTESLTDSPTGTDATGCFHDHIVFISCTAAIIVDAIAICVVNGRQPRRAGVLQDTVDTAVNPLGTTSPNSALGRLCTKILIDLSIAVIIDTVTGSVVCCGLPLDACIYDRAVSADLLSCSTAGTDSAGRVSYGVIFISLTTAIIVDTVAVGVIGCRLSGLAIILEHSVNAAVYPLGNAGTHTALSRGRTKVLVGTAVAIIIHAITS